MMTKSTNFYDWRDVFDYSVGLNLAVGFTAYDNEREIILDETIGELAFIAYEWGEKPDGTFYVTREKIPSR